MDKANIDTQKLRRLISNFSSHAKPSDAVLNHSCTVQDIRKVVDDVAALLTAFVNELEQHSE